MIFCTFVQNFSLNTVPDGGQRDAAPQQIPRHTVIIRCRVRQPERRALAFHRLMLHWDVHRAFLTQQLHRLYKRYTFHINQIFQRRLAANVAAFPVPHTGFTVDFETVMFCKLVLAPRTAFHQRIGSIPPQELDCRHPVSGINLFFTDAR